MTGLTLGFDPGLTGAIAALDPHGALMWVEDMPALDGQVSAGALAAIVDKPIPVQWLGCTVTSAWVEQVAARPGQGVSSMFKFGRSYGVVLGVLGARAIPTHHVTPARWKRSANVTADKGSSRRLAIELWGAHAELFARVKDDGRAEAALIARHGWLAHQRGEA